MNILFVVSEAVPLVKSGGLGEFAGSLPKSLGPLGANVRVMLPGHREIAAVHRRAFQEVMQGRVEIGGVPHPWRLLEADVEGIHYYLIENAYYFGSSTLYGYGDETERYIFFCLVVLEVLPGLQFAPDIIHCHDWQTALLPVLMRNSRQSGSRERTMPSILTIHNMHYQGRDEKGQFRQWLGGKYDEAWSQTGQLHTGGDTAAKNDETVSCLELGLVAASRVTTVSPSYAAEIRGEPGGAGLSPVILTRQDEVLGICNGIDTAYYDSMQDHEIVFPYKSWAGKRANKLALQRRLGLREDGAAPLFAIVSRLVRQKGLDLIIAQLSQLLSLGIQLAVIGSGEDYYQNFFRSAAVQHPESLSVHTVFDDRLAKQIYAGSDFLLMPSLYEPCGISQLIALQFRTVPVVRLTGGLKDTIRPYNPETGQGNGFGFEDYHPGQLLAAVGQALEVYHDARHWAALQHSIAAGDYGWGNSAMAYMHLYKELWSSSENQDS